MRRTEMREMRFEEVYTGWTESWLTQEEAARILGVCDRTFRRYIELNQASFCRAPVDEVMAVADRYKSHYRGWNVKHFYLKYQKDVGQRSYSWFKNTLQSRGLVSKVSKRGIHRKHRDRSPLPGLGIIPCFL
jgi:hypothetical protein